MNSRRGFIDNPVLRNEFVLLRAARPEEENSVIDYLHMVGGTDPGRSQGELLIPSLAGLPQTRPSQNKVPKSVATYCVFRNVLQ